MSIRTGDHAPGFELPQKAGDTVDVGAVIGTEPVVLLFFPFAFSSVCTAEMCHMRDNWTSYEGTGAKVFAISIDSPFVVDKYRQEQKTPFPILSDFNKTVAKQYGALHDDLMGLKGVTKRAAFVIDRDGTVVYDWVTDDPSQQVPFKEVDAALQKLTSNV
ncbi:MAG: redoxin domain-containing protein [Phycisphaerales bacterium]|nr:redoxin domain-containing protein [Phycisphaerales bacterium]